MFIVLPPSTSGARATVNFESIMIFEAVGNFVTLIPIHGDTDYSIEYPDAEKAKEVCNHLSAQLVAVRL